MSLFLANKLCQSYGDYGVMFWERWRNIYELRGEFKGSLLIWNNVYSQASPVTFLWLHWWCRTFSCFFMCVCVCVCVFKCESPQTISWQMNIECWHFFESECQFSEHSKKTQKWVSVCSQAPCCLTPSEDESLLNCKCRAWTTAISLIIISLTPSSSSSSSSLWMCFFSTITPTERCVWKDLWECVVPCAQVAPERWRSLVVNKPPSVIRMLWRWEVNGNRLALNWCGVSGR